MSTQRGRDEAEQTFVIDGMDTELFRVVNFEADEEISRLFEVRVDLVSADLDVDLEAAMGKDAVLTLHHSEGERYFHGIVRRMEATEEGTHQARYSVVVVPMMWLLTQRRDCRIFQAKSVPDIVKEVLEAHGISGGDLLADRLSGSYSPRDYCVQYRESDHAFVSRLLEEEGIWFAFEHSDSGHVLVLGDDPGGSSEVPDAATLEFHAASTGATEDQHIDQFRADRQVRSGKATLRDYGFKQPTQDLESEAEAELNPELEVYDFPGEYVDPTIGDTLVKLRLEELQTPRSRAQGEGDARRFTAGMRFTLSNHPRSDLNQEYLLVKVHHQGAQPDPWSPSSSSGEGSEPRKPLYRNRFQAIPYSIPFRPARRTPRPSIPGVHTAVVVGPSGEEIYVDEHARVKVQFPWDRLGTSDENSSCWIRVSQIWAGVGWGGMFIPRIGQEVIVQFIEGDPDRPLITGRVYNGDNPPPYSLPGDKTRSTIKSNSSKGGGGYNELRFEDLAGSEEIWLHGQKDWNILIENDKNQTIGHDETADVGNDRTRHVAHDESITVDNNETRVVGVDRTRDVGNNETLTIGNDRTKSVGNNETMDVGVDQSETIGSNLTLSVGADQTESVGANKSQSVGASRTEDVAADVTITIGGSQTETISVSDTQTVGVAQTITVGAARTVTVGAAQTTSVGAAYTLSVGAVSTESVAGTKSVSVGGAASEAIGGALSVTVGGAWVGSAGGNLGLSTGADLSLQASGKGDVGAGGDLGVGSGAKMTVQAETELTIACGSAQITLKSGGDIVIKGSKITVEASGDLILKGSKIAAN